MTLYVKSMSIRHQGPLTGVFSSLQVGRRDVLPETRVGQNLMADGHLHCMLHCIYIYI